MTRKNALIEELRREVAQCEEAKDRIDRLRPTTQPDRLVLAGMYGQPTEARACVLAVVLMLENKLDALQVTEYAHVKQGNVEQARIDQLRGLVGDVSEEETAAAVGLWEEVAE